MRPSSSRAPPGAVRAPRGARRSDEARAAPSPSPAPSPLPSSLYLGVAALLAVGLLLRFSVFGHGWWDTANAVASSSTSSVPLSAVYAPVSSVTPPEDTRALPPPPPSSLPPASQPTSCSSRFLGYRPSTLETEWAAHIARPGAPLNTRLFCEDLISAPFRDRMQYWVGTSASQNAERPTTRAGIAAQAAQLAARDDVFSRLDFEDSCTGATWSSRVAPLAGMLRDPRGPCLFASGAFVAAPLLPLLTGGGEMLQVKDTVVVDAAYIQRVAAEHATARAAGVPRRAILMDAGASTYKQGVVAGEWPGTRWLVERYRDLGVNFTDIFAWEVTQHPGSEFFDGMSPELIAATRFYNFPVTAEPGPANPISVLKAVASPGDFVVFKLDIDHPNTETPLVAAMLEDDDALALIDDFYYELHFGLKEMEGFWGGGMPGDLVSATSVFRRFREKGVACQFWP